MGALLGESWLPFAAASIVDDITINTCKGIIIADYSVEALNNIITMAPAHAVGANLVAGTPPNVCIQWECSVAGNATKFRYVPHHCR